MELSGGKPFFYFKYLGSELESNGLSQSNFRFQHPEQLALVLKDMVL